MIDVRTANAGDLPAIFALFRAELDREPREADTADWVRDFPSAVVAVDGSLVGFAYAKRFAPDVLELVNLLVATRCRGAGLGQLLLAHVQAAARADYAGIILTNSDLYPDGAVAKRPATAFYLRNGFQLLTSTGPTRIFYRALREDVAARMPGVAAVKAGTLHTPATESP